MRGARLFFLRQRTSNPPRDGQVRGGTAAWVCYVPRPGGCASGLYAPRCLPRAHRSAARSADQHRTAQAPSASSGCIARAGGMRAAAVPKYPAAGDRHPVVGKPALRRILLRRRMIRVRSTSAVPDPRPAVAISLPQSAASAARVRFSLARPVAACPDSIPRKGF